MCILVFSSLSIIWYFVTVIIKKNRKTILDNINTSVETITYYAKIKNIITVVAAINAIYYIVICYFLGWEPYRAYIAYTIAIGTVLLLDWILIAVSYHKESHQNLFGLKLYWLSFYYTIIRGVYVIGIVCWLTFSFFTGIYGFIYAVARSTTFIPDMLIETLRIKTFGDKTYGYNFFKRTNMFIRQYENENLRFAFPNGKNLNESDYIIVQSSHLSSSFHIYKSKYYFFKKYLYSVKANVANQDPLISYSEDRDTLYIGKPSQNYIVKQNNKYIHTITGRIPSSQSSQFTKSKASRMEYVTESIKMNEF